MNTQRSDRCFFTGLGIWAFLLTVIGFSPTFYLRPAEKEPLPLYIVLHGVLASLWVLFFLLQAGLISAQQRKLHATLGLISIPLGLAVAATGAVVALRSLERQGNPIWHVCLSLNNPHPPDVIRGPIFSIDTLFPLANADISHGDQFVGGKGVP